MDRRAGASRGLRQYRQPLLVRGMSRRAELSIRSALGAQRSRIVRQLLHGKRCSLGMGGLLGLAVSYLGAHALLALAFPESAQHAGHCFAFALVIGFAFALSLVTGVLFGLAPALMAARAQPAEALRSNSRTTAHGASFLQRGLVVMQAALSLVLLVAAGLICTEPQQGREREHETGYIEPLHCPHQSAGGRLQDYRSRAPLPDHR
jgi:hypothetical protein